MLLLPIHNPVIEHKVDSFNLAIGVLQQFCMFLYFKVIDVIAAKQRTDTRAWTIT